MSGGTRAQRTPGPLEGKRDFEGEGRTLGGVEQRRGGLMVLGSLALAPEPGGMGISE